MSPAVKRHMMPATVALAFAAVAVPAAAAGRVGWGHVALGLALLGAYWAVEWRGIEGTFEDRTPGGPRVALVRAVWLAALVLTVVDACWTRWTPWRGPAVRAAGVALFLGGIALRLWSMRTLRGAFSYDLKVTEGHALVRAGPYRIVRHPSYAGLLLWSAGFALWNPSVPGLVLLVALTVQHVAARVRVEERMLEDHFGEAWREHARATWSVVPLVW
jgi:protein-S-isoprenylcysteine O-methyltransferase